MKKHARSSWLQLDMDLGWDWISTGWLGENALGKLNPTVASIFLEHLWK